MEKFIFDRYDESFQLYLDDNGDEIKPIYRRNKFLPDKPPKRSPIKRRSERLYNTKVYRKRGPKKIPTKTRRSTRINN